MSRGFVKEEDQEEAPFIPPRAALPAGVENYVTPEGYQALLDEKEELIAERQNKEGKSEAEKRRHSTEIDGKIALLDERINTARKVEPETQYDQVKFGCTVSFKLENGPTRTFKIVGVDEANIKEQKVAFVAPIVRAMLGKKEGEEFEFSLGSNTQRFTVVEIK